MINSAIARLQIAKALEASAVVNTQEYKKKHGKEPSGKGHWRFFSRDPAKHKNDNKSTLSFSGDYNYAVKEALKEANKGGHLSTIYVAP